MNIFAIDVVPGDVITTDSDDITVTAVEPVLDTEMVRIYGRITRGFGAGRKVRSWTKYADDSVDVVRSNEEVYHFTPDGRARRVR